MTLLQHKWDNNSSQYQLKFAYNGHIFYINYLNTLHFNIGKCLSIYPTYFFLIFFYIINQKEVI